MAGEAREIRYQNERWLNLQIHRLSTNLGFAAANGADGASARLTHGDHVAL